ncbi:MAG: glutamine amidotransferase [Thermodesulfobacteriota bacterium]
MRGRILIVKAGGTFPGLAADRGDFEDWVAEGLGVDPDRLLVRCPPLGEALPEPSSLSGAVVTGSHAMVTDRERWSEATSGWLRDALSAGKPLLGICYGHQLLAEAAGGRAGYNPRGREFGTAEIRLLSGAKEDPLFRGLPGTIPVHVCHAQSVIVLPHGAVPLAESGRDPRQAFRMGERAWGVQFHPEFSADAARAYVRACAGELRAEGQDPEALEAAIRDTPESRELLRRFGALAS